MQFVISMYDRLYLLQTLTIGTKLLCMLFQNMKCLAFFKIYAFTCFLVSTPFIHVWVIRPKKPRPPSPGPLFPAHPGGTPRNSQELFSPGASSPSLRRRPRGILIRYLNQPNWFVQCGGDKMNDRTPSSYLAELCHPAEEACFCFL